MTPLLRTCWCAAWGLLVVGSTIAAIDVSYKTCGTHIPILLSRALTTDPYRGATLVFCLFASISSIYLNSIILTTAFFGFLGAFQISMFLTPSSHDALILFSSILVMYECLPPKENIKWRIHWTFTVISGLFCIGWFLYIIYGCDAAGYDGPLPLPPEVYCARCSWWFVTEYVTFWSMFMLVYWKIKPGSRWRDQIMEQRAGTNKKAAVGTNKVDPLERLSF